MSDIENQESRSLEVPSKDRLKASFERVSHIDEKTKKIIEDYSVKALNGEGPEIGFRLNGAAQSALANGDTSKAKKEKEAFSRWLLKISVDQAIGEMRQAVDDYINELKNEIEVLEIQRDEIAADIADLENEYEQIKNDLTDIQRGIDRIENGEELELDENGELKDPKLETLISEYERRNGTDIDRGDTALLLAVLKAEDERLRHEGKLLREELESKEASLNKTDQKIEELKNNLSEAEEFKVDLDRIEGIANEAEREEALKNLLENTPDHLLSHMVEHENVSAEVKEKIGQTLSQRIEVAKADDLENDELLDALSSELENSGDTILKNQSGLSIPVV